MDKSELETKAEKICEYTDQIHRDCFVNGYITGALKREKKIADLEKLLEEEKKLNAEIKVRFVKCNTCTQEMKNRCLMFTENLCEGERCEELVDIMALVDKRDSDDKLALLGERCNQLLKDKGELTDRLSEEVELHLHAEEYIKSLEQQIEKMKCCGNCKYYTPRGEKHCSRPNLDCYGLLTGVAKNKWELKNE